MKDFVIGKKYEVTERFIRSTDEDEIDFNIGCILKKVEDDEINKFNGTLAFEFDGKRIGLADCNPLRNNLKPMVTNEEFLLMKEAYSTFCTDEKYIEIAKAAYEKGLNIGSTGVIKVTIAETGVWSARVQYKNSVGTMESFEKVGFHTGSNSFIQGVKDAGIPVVDRRPHCDSCGQTV